MTSRQAELLGHTQGRMKGVSLMRTVLHVIPLQPSGRGDTGDIEHLAA
jgi:hypothetical protein